MTRLLIPVWLTVAMHTSLAAASVRELPYPFEHKISFASDADGMQPWYLAGLHRVLNEELGLPVSDSLWPDGSNHYKASDVGINPDWVDNDFLFRTLTRRNDTASGVRNPHHIRNSVATVAPRQRRLLPRLEPGLYAAASRGV